MVVLYLLIPTMLECYDSSILFMTPQQSVKRSKQIGVNGEVKTQASSLLRH